MRSKKRYEQETDPDVKSLPEYFLDSASRCGMTLPVTPHNDAGSSCEPLVGNIGTYNPCVLKRGTSKKPTLM